MTRTDVVTLSEWIRAAERALSEARVPSPRHDAERLAAHELDLPWGELWPRLRDPIDRSTLSRMDSSLTRRASGEPLAYIAGSVVFYGIEIACGPGVLVPRPETEVLVDTALELIEGTDSPVVVDVGTGSGAVAIAVSAQRGGAEVWGTDVSPVALGYATRNAVRAAVSVRLVQGDLFGALPHRMRGAIDLIVSNPPYVPGSAELPSDVLAEPYDALRAGPRGDECLLRIVDEADAWLSPHGALALEVGTSEQARIIEREVARFGRSGMRRDQNGRPRVVWARR